MLGGTRLVRLGSSSPPPLAGAAPPASRPPRASSAQVVGGLFGRPMNRLLGNFFVLFNAGVRRLTRGYGAVVGGLLRHSVLALAAYAGLWA